LKLLRRIGIGVVAGLVLAYLAVLAGMYFLQRDFQYDRSGRLFELTETTLTNAELVTIPTGEDTTVTGWYAPPAEGKPVILYYRGNAQSFSREHVRFEQFVADGYGFVSFDYRGFPGSPGELNQANVLNDSLAVFDWVAAKGDPVLVWGRSLGSGPATYVASERQADALLLETPFLSAVSVAADRYGFLPVGLLMLDQYPVDSWLPKVDEPVFVAHGTADRTIGVSHGERVYGLAPIKAGLWIVPDADHGDLWDRGLWTEAKAFFEGVSAAK
jgi:uncharacterized protein